MQCSTLIMSLESAFLFVFQFTMRSMRPLA